MSALDFYRQQYPDVFGEMNDYQALQELSRGSGKSVDEVAAKLGIDAPSLLGEAKKGVSRGIDQLQGTAYAGVGWLGDVVGADSVRDWGLSGMRRNAEEAAQQAAAVGDYRDVGGLRDALMFAAGAGGEALPQLVPGLGASGIGARMAASAAAKRATAEGLKLAAKKKLIGDAVERGALQGGAAYGIASETANNYGDIYEKTGEHAPGTALAHGVPGGLLEGLSERLLFKNVAKGVPKGMSRSRYVAQEAGKQFLTGGVLEELPQTLLSQAAVNAVDPTVGYDKHELVNATLKGGIGSSMIGTGGAMVTRRQKDGTERDLLGKGIDLFHKGTEAFARKRARDHIAASDPALAADDTLRGGIGKIMAGKSTHDFLSPPPADMSNDEVSQYYHSLADKEADRILTAQPRSLGGNEKELRDAAEHYKTTRDWAALRQALGDAERKQSRSSMMEEFDNGAKFSDMSMDKDELSSLATAWQANEGKKHSWVFDESDDGEALSAKLFGWIKSGFGKDVNDGKVFLPTRMLEELGETAPKVIQSAISAARKEGWDVEGAGDIVEQVKSHVMRNSGDVSVLRNTLRYSQEANWNDQMLQRLAKELRSKKGQMGKEDYKWLRSQFSDPEKVVAHFRSDSSYYKAPNKLKGSATTTEAELNQDGGASEDDDAFNADVDVYGSDAITENDDDWNSGVSEIEASSKRRFSGTDGDGRPYDVSDPEQRAKLKTRVSTYASDPAVFAKEVGVWTQARRAAGGNKELQKEYEDALLVEHTRDLAHEGEFHNDLNPDDLSLDERRALLSQINKRFKTIEIEKVDPAPDPHKIPKSEIGSFRVNAVSKDANGQNRRDPSRELVGDGFLYLERIIGGKVTAFPTTTARLLQHMRGRGDRKGAANIEKDVEVKGKDAGAAGALTHLEQAIADLITSDPTFTGRIGIRENASDNAPRWLSQNEKLPKVMPIGDGRHTVAQGMRRRASEANRTYDDFDPEMEATIGDRETSVEEPYQAKVLLSGQGDASERVTKAVEPVDDYGFLVGEVGDRALDRRLRHGAKPAASTGVTRLVDEVRFYHKDSDGEFIANTREAAQALKQSLSGTKAGELTVVKRDGQWGVLHRFKTKVRDSRTVSEIDEMNQGAVEKEDRTPRNFDELAGLSLAIDIPSGLRKFAENVLRNARVAYKLATPKEREILARLIGNKKYSSANKLADNIRAKREAEKKDVEVVSAEQTGARGQSGNSERHSRAPTSAPVPGPGAVLQGDSRRGAGSDPQNRKGDSHRNAGERNPNENAAGAASVKSGQNDKVDLAKQLQAYLDQYGAKNAVWARAATRALAENTPTQITGALAAAKKQFGELTDDADLERHQMSKAVEPSSLPPNTPVWAVYEHRDDGEAGKFVAAFRDIGAAQWLAEKKGYTLVNEMAGELSKVANLVDIAKPPAFAKAKEQAKLDGADYVFAPIGVEGSFASRLAEAAKRAGKLINPNGTENIRDKVVYISVPGASRGFTGMEQFLADVRKLLDRGAIIRTDTNEHASRPHNAAGEGKLRQMLAFANLNLTEGKLFDSWQKNLPRAKEQPASQSVRSEGEKGSFENPHSLPMRYVIHNIEDIRPELRNKYRAGDGIAKLIANGDRTATTRTPPAGVKVGDYVSFPGVPGVYRITGFDKIDLKSRAGIEAWSKKEGWDTSMVNAFGKQVSHGSTQMSFERANGTRGSEASVGESGQERRGSDEVSKFSKQSPIDKPINPEEAIAYLKQAFGQDFAVEVVEQLGGHAGMWTEHGILMAATASDGTQFHEAVHELFRQLRKHGAENVKALIERVATSPLMKRKLEQLLEAHPKAREQLKSPEEAAAFMFQFWNLGLLKVGPETKGLFETIKSLIAKAAKKLLSLVDAQYRAEYNAKERERADTEAAFEALDMLLNHGKLANKDTRQAIYDALRKNVEAHDNAMQNLGRGVDKFYRTWGKLFVSNEAMLALYKEHPELRLIADKFHQVHGAAMKNQARDSTLDAYGGFMEAVGSVTNKWMTRMERMLDGYDQKDLELALKYLERGKGNSSDPKIAKLVDDVRKYMGDMYDYMVESDVRRLDPSSEERWVPVERRTDYWTQVWDVESLLGKRDAFIEKLLSHHMSNLKQMADEANKEVAAWQKNNKAKPGSPTARAAVESGNFETITPEAVAESIYSRLINSMGMIDIEENEWSMGITPGAAAVNRRQLNWLDKEAFSEFKSKDMVNIMTTYTRSMIKRGEYQKRFGYGGEVIAKSVDTAWLREMGGQELVDAAEDALPLAIKAWKMAAAAWHADNPDAPFPEPYPTLRDVGVAHFRSQNGDEKTNEALVSAEEALRPAINSIRAMEGTLGAEISPTMRNFNSWAVSYQNVRLLPLMLFANLSDVIGITVQGGTLGDAWNTFVEGMRGVRDSWKGERNKGAMMSRAEEWGVVDAGALLDSLGQVYGSVYMSQGARRFNEKFFRVIGAEGWNRGIRAAAASVGERIILDWAKNGVDMKKAGEKERFERLFGEGADPKGITLNSDGSLDTRDHRNRAAINRFVQDSIMTSNAAHRTAWMADPRYATFAHLKNFAYTFHRVMLLGILDQAKKGNLRPAAVAGLGYASIAIAGGAVKEMLIPGDEPPWMKGGLDSYLEYGYRQAGLGGVPMMWLDSALDLDPAKAAGPMWDQIQNTISSPIPGFNLNLSPFDGETEILKDRKVLSEISRALPGGNIAGRWMDNALRD